MENINLISSVEFQRRCDEEDRSGRLYISWVGCNEIRGKYCTTWRDERTKELFAVESVKSVHMGFNSNEDGKIEELISTVEKYGRAKASYGVLGRTCHEILSYELSKILSQYDFTIGGYDCIVKKR